MGLFSSKKKKIVGTTVTRVVEDEDMPVPFQKSVIQAIMRNESVADNVLDELMTGRVSTFNRVFNYAKSGNYVYGLPNETISETVGSRAATESVITGLENQNISTRYYRMLPVNFVHWVYEQLVVLYGYDGATNQLSVLTNQKGYPVHLKTFSITLTGDEEDYPETSLQLWGDHPESLPTPSRPGGPSASLPGLISFGASSAVNITVEWETSSGGAGTAYSPPDLSVPVVLQSGYIAPDLATPVVLSSSSGSGPVIEEEVLQLSLPAFSADAVYHQIAYTTASGQASYWSYLHGSGTYPLIDSGALSEITTDTGYMPFTFFISAGYNLGASGRENDIQYQSAERFLDIIGMDFREVCDNLQDNPDIDDVKQAAMLFGIPIESDDPDELEYLFHHMEYFYQLNTPMPVSALDTAVPNYSIAFADSDFRMELDYIAITESTEAGNIGPVGSYSAITTSTSYTYEKTTRRGGDETTETVTSSYQVRRFRKQISATEFKEYAIHDPRMVFYVEGSRAVYVQLGDDEGRMVLPMNRNIIKRFNYRQKERLYLRSMHFVFNSLQVVKVKWYQTGIFKAFLVVVAIVITVFSAGAGIGTLSASLGISTLAATVMYIVIAVAISFAFKFTIRQLGLENSWIAVAIAIALAAYTGYTGESIAGFLDAKTLISLASGLANEIGTYANQLIAKYQGDLQEFELYKEEKWEELEEASKLLDTTDLLDPFNFIGLQPIVIPGESSDSFYQRTIHSGNIGTQVFDMVHEYVDTNLRLPTFEDSVRSTFYGRTV